MNGHSLSANTLDTPRSNASSSSLTDAERIFNANHIFHMIDAIQAPVPEVDFECPDFSLGWWHSFFIPSPF